MKTEAQREAKRRQRQARSRRVSGSRKQHDGKPCTYCARPMDLKVPSLYPTLDHVEPKSMKGKITVWACFTCNHVKRDMTPDQWAIYRDEHPEWWINGRRARNALNWKIRPVAICETASDSVV